MTELICIVCPNGCHLTVDDAHDFAVTGSGCARGEAYARAELTAPTRTLTSTVRIVGAPLRRCPVKSSAALPKALLFEAMAALNAAELHAPVHIGDVVLSQICGTEADIVVTRDL